MIIKWEELTNAVFEMWVTFTPHVQNDLVRSLHRLLDREADVTTTPEIARAFVVGFALGQAVLEDGNQDKLTTAMVTPALAIANRWTDLG